MRWVALFAALILVLAWLVWPLVRAVFTDRAIRRRRLAEIRVWNEIVRQWDED